MALPRSTRPVRVIRLYWPVSVETIVAMTTGDGDAVARDPALVAMFAIVRADNALGDFGVYRSVVELAPGWEFFTPAAGARPTLGTADTGQASPTVIVTLHVPADVRDDVFDQLLDQLIAAHPWEVPVIELTAAALLLRR